MPRRPRSPWLAAGGRGGAGSRWAGELTSGQADQKEGLYFGEELAADDARVRAGRPLHGANLFPASAPALRPAVLAWMDEMTTLGHVVMRGIALALGPGRGWFEHELTRRPDGALPDLPLPTDVRTGGWGVGEHTDYGLLTMLAAGRLRRAPGALADAAGSTSRTAPGTLVCNIGDMLDRMTGGRYRSTPHRVRNDSGREPAVVPVLLRPRLGRAGPAGAARRRGSGRRRRRPLGRRQRPRWEGTYGEYLLGKVAKVFPDLAAEVG